MTIGAIIQARMNSRRLPGKVLLPLGSKPLLQHVIDVLAQVSSLAGIIIATSREKSDDVLVKYCQQQGVAYFRGSQENVADRFLQALMKQGWEAAARISADSPLLDRCLVEQAVAMFASGEWDIVTNVFPRTYPHGQSVEVVSRQALTQAYQNFSQPAEFEHVTPYFYTHAADWRIGQIISAPDRSQESVAVDTAEDLQHLETLISARVKA